MLVKQIVITKGDLGSLRELSDFAPFCPSDGQSSYENYDSTYSLVEIECHSLLNNVNLNEFD